MIKLSITVSLLHLMLCLHAEDWQQRLKYQMDIDFNTDTHQFTGKQQVTYYNHSPDTISRMYYHLYFNAFQPGSAMDVWNQNVIDPDMRISQIRHLQPEEYGFLHVQRLTQGAEHLRFVENETILEVDLAAQIYPGDSTVLVMDFIGQVPIQVRRSGRDNAEGISYSMSQWYPKVCAYDADGWHPNPYISREFYGNFGDFDVKVTIDREYIVGATGELQNGNTIGYGYEDEGVVVPEIRTHEITWHFIANNVHDFVWAADPDYTHTTFQRDDGMVMRFLFQETEYNAKAWAELPKILDQVFVIANARFGQYPYPTFAFIQAGDSGMEYPMATLITGNRPLRSLVGVCVHELMHSWFHGVLATNELRDGWMDEGFANYTTILIMQELDRLNLLPGNQSSGNYFASDYTNYFQVIRFGIEEPMSTHGDHFLTNTAYYSATYYKGCVFLAQLEYIIGSASMQRVLRRYYETWKFRHPRPLDFIRIAELESGMILDWYYEYWILSTKTIDYGIEEIEAQGAETKITLRRNGIMPMPLEIVAKTKNGNAFLIYIPIDLMRVDKPADEDRTRMEVWPRVSREYQFTIPIRFNQLTSIEIDPSLRMADVNREDNFRALNESPND